MSTYGYTYYSAFTGDKGADNHIKLLSHDEGLWVKISKKPDSSWPWGATTKDRKRQAIASDPVGFYRGYGSGGTGESVDEIKTKDLFAGHTSEQNIDA